MPIRRSFAPSALSLAVSGSACLCAAAARAARRARGSPWRAFRAGASSCSCSTRCSPCPRSWSAWPSTCCCRAAARSARWGMLFTPAAMVHRADHPRAADHHRARAPGRRRRRCATAATSCARWAPARSPRALLMLLHERWAVVTVMLIAFGRAIAEVGAVMIVGGNIDGVTRVMTTTIALETSKGDLPLALALGLVLLGVVALLNVAIALFRRGSGPLAARAAMTVLAGVDPDRAARGLGRLRRGAGGAQRDDARRPRAISSPSSAPTAPARPACCACCTGSSRTRGSRAMPRAGRRPGDGVPAALPAPAFGLEQPAHRALAGPPATPRPRCATSAPDRRCAASASARCATGRRVRSRAASSSGSRSRAAGRCGRTSCFSTSRRPASTRRRRRTSRRCSPTSPPTA